MKQGSRLWVLGALFLLIFGLGCEDAVIDPFNNDSKYFTVYGFLDESNNFIPGARHALRVIPVTRNAERIESPDDPQASIDARVFLTDVTDSLTTEMLHELKELEPGVYGHIYSSSLFLRPNHQYRVEIIRKDEQFTYAETQLPNLSSVRAEQQDPIVNADSTDIRQNIVLTGIKALWNVDVIYHVSGPACFQAARIPVSYGRVGRATENGWEIEVDITRDRQQIGAANQTICAMGIRARVMDDQWIFPEGELNLEELALPEMLTNVENGYGFVGSVGLLQLDWPLSAELSEALE